MEVGHQYVKQRKEFGRHPLFNDGGAVMLADIRPNEEHMRNFVVRNPMSSAVQVGPTMSEHEVNTNAVVLVNKAMCHTEGGWPKEVDCTEVEQVIRYRRKVEKDEGYIRAIMALSSVAERIVKENNAIDIYEEYWEGQNLDYSTEPASASTITQLHDPSASRRGAQYISWHPDGSCKLAVAYAVLEFQGQLDGACIDSFIWDVANPGEPEATLSPKSALTCVAHNLKDNKVLGAGQYNGQFAVFDTRQGAAPVDATPIEQSHRDPVYDLAWLQSKTGSEAMTVSSDGRVLWWDTRRLGEPVEALPLTERGSEALLGAVCLDYSPTAGPTKFMVGTEQGSLLLCNRKAKTLADRVGAAYPGHHAAVYGVARSPFFPKCFASAGDWTVRLWNEDVRAPLVASAYHAAYLSSVRWSPTRPSVFFTARSDGVLDAWDYYLNGQNEPALSTQVAGCALTALRVHEGGALAAVGCADGTTSVLQLSAGLIDPQPSEKAATLAMLERETSREKNLEKAQKEARIRARKEAQRAADGVPSSQADDSPDMQQLEEDFMKMTQV